MEYFYLIFHQTQVVLALTDAKSHVFQETYYNGRRTLQEVNFEADILNAADINGYGVYDSESSRLYKYFIAFFNFPTKII